MRLLGGEGGLYRGPRLGRQEARPEVRLGAKRLVQRPPSGPQEARPEVGLQVMQTLSVGTVEGKNICALFGVVRGRSRKL